MAKYLLVYHGGSMPETEAGQASVMKAWTDWFAQLGALADGEPGVADEDDQRRPVRGRRRPDVAVRLLDP